MHCISLTSEAATVHYAEHTFLFFRLYAKKNQLKSIGDQLGTTFANEIISTKSSSTNYLAKGHLTPDAAMVYDFEQKATYFFINVAPQFQAFNNGNWKYLEDRARKLAVK